MFYVCLLISAALAILGIVAWVSLHRSIAHIKARLARTANRSHLVNLRVVGAWRELARQAVLFQHGPEVAARTPFYANAGEDAFLVLLFDAQREGYLIEAGAYDGVRHSVSATLEALGWAGLLVEARPDSAAACASARPGMRVVHGALVGPGAPPEVEFAMVMGSSSGERVSHLASGAAAERTHLVAAGSTQRRVMVKSYTLESLLSQVPIVDALILDLEGAEAEALRGLGPRLGHVRVLLLEESNTKPRPELHATLAEAGLGFMGYFGGNAVFVAQGEGALRRRAAQLLYANPDDVPPVPPSEYARAAARSSRQGVGTLMGP